MMPVRSIHRELETRIESQGFLTAMSSLLDESPICEFTRWGQRTIRWRNFSDTLPIDTIAAQFISAMGPRYPADKESISHRLSTRENVKERLVWDNLGMKIRMLYEESNRCLGNLTDAERIVVLARATLDFWCCSSGCFTSQENIDETLLNWGYDDIYDTRRPLFRFHKSAFHQLFPETRIETRKEADKRRAEDRKSKETVEEDWNHQGYVVVEKEELERLVLLHLDSTPAQPT